MTACQSPSAGAERRRLLRRGFDPRFDFDERSGGIVTSRGRPVRKIKVVYIDATNEVADDDQGTGLASELDRKLACEWAAEPDWNLEADERGSDGDLAFGSGVLWPSDVAELIDFYSGAGFDGGWRRVECDNGAGIRRHRQLARRLQRLPSRLARVLEACAHWSLEAPRERRFWFRACFGQLAPLVEARLGVADASLLARIILRAAQTYDPEARAALLGRWHSIERRLLDALADAELAWVRAREREPETRTTARRVARRAGRRRVVEMHSTDRAAHSTAEPQKLSDVFATIAEVADAHGVKSRTIHDRIKRGALPGGRHARGIALAALDPHTRQAILAKRSVNAGSPNRRGSTSRSTAQTR